MPRVGNGDPWDDDRAVLQRRIAEEPGCVWVEYTQESWPEKHWREAFEGFMIPVLPVLPPGHVEILFLRAGFLDPAAHLPDLRYVAGGLEQHLLRDRPRLIPCGLGVVPDVVGEAASLLWWWWVILR